MSVVKTVHLGGIVKDEQLIKTFAAPTRIDLIKDLDGWVFDYCYANSKTINCLPPLDDWSHSVEDNTYWSLSGYPEGGWSLWIRYELMDFR